MKQEPPVYVTRALLPSFQDYVEMIRPLWDSHILTNQGTLYFRFKDALTNYLKVPELVLCANGHLALEAVLQSLQIHGEVITTPFTFISTTNAIIRAGLTPVFCDILSDEYTMDPASIERCITPNTCAILPVHVFGNLCDMDAIDRLAEHYHLPVIYDAAHTFGIHQENTNAESFYLRGTASIISFHATKVFNSVEGGAVISKNLDLLNRVFLNTNYGFENSEISEWVGGNAKMSEFHAAMGLCNLPSVESEILRRKHVASLYSELLTGLNEIVLPPTQPGIRSNYAYYPVVFKQGQQVRDKVYNCLAQCGFYSRRYFYPLTCDHPQVRRIRPSTPISVAQTISDGILCLPLYGDLCSEAVENICMIIMKALSED